MRVCLNKELIIKYLILIIFTSISIFVFAASILYTVDVIYPVDLVFRKDSIALNVVSLLLAMVILLVIKRTANVLHLSSGNTRLVLSLIIMASLMCMVTIVRFELTADQYYCMEYAKQFLAGDYMQWNDAYMSNFPFQNLLVLWDALLIKMFGDNAVLVFQYLNIVAFVGIIYFIQKGFDELFGNNSSRYIFLVMLLFVPFSFYVILCYGIMIGLFFSVLSIWAFILWTKIRQLKYLFICAIAASIATLIKSNYLIVLVGIVLYLLFDLIMHCQWKNIMGIVLILLIYIFGSKLVTMYVEDRTGIPSGKGIPKMAWVTMGTLENDGSPGWWSSYNIYVFDKNNRDYDATNNECKEYFVGRMKVLLENPKRFIRFYGKKLTSEWACPTWECFTFQKELKSDVLERIMNFLQTMLYFGLLIFSVTLWKNVNDISVNKLIYAVMLIGGFLFFMFWEAKSQYVMPFYFLAIPYSVMGWKKFVRFVETKYEQMGR